MRMRRRYFMKKFIIMAVCLCLFVPVRVQGSDFEARIKAMEETLQKQVEIIKAQQKMIDELKEQMKTAGSAAVVEHQIEKSTAPEEMPGVVVAEQRPAPEKQEQVKKGGLWGGSWMTNPNISLILNTYAYSSNLRTDELGSRGLPGYTTEGLSRRNGFNLDAAELYLYAPVDPYFNLYATIPVTEDGAELEEVYFVTTALPKGHQFKGGKFKSGFGRLNAFHPHAWDFVDTPLPYRGFTGGEGIIEKGLQYTYLTPLPIYTLLGVEVLQGENKTLFGADAASGAHAYTAFVKSSVDAGDYSTILFGPSVITGKTKTDTVAAGADFTGDTTLYGLEFTYKWKPAKYRGFKLQAEYLYRSQFGNLTHLGSGTVSRLDRNQDGLYLQGVALWNRWEFGIRYDTLGLFRDGYNLNGVQQDTGRRPWRITGMVDYNFSEFSLLRFQYNHDETDIGGKTNHELFLQFIFSMGAHGAHAF